MVELLKEVLHSQYAAALAMLEQCIAACRDEHWEGRIANGTFRQIAYHTLFFTDLYLTPACDEFRLRDVHHRGGDERGPTLSSGLDKAETLSYVRICRTKSRESIDAETEASLAGPSGWRDGVNRVELHVYNIRHIQHHAGALSAYLRRVDPELMNHPGRRLKWVGRG
jgi:hypothetical protein